MAWSPGPAPPAGAIRGVRLCDQGVDHEGNPDAGYMPGMDIHAALTVVGDGPVGAVGRQLDEHFGLPEGHHQREWAVGMKVVVDLPEDTGLEPGTVLHTFGYPEPEIFGFLYVHPGRVASAGIFVPSWFRVPRAPPTATCSTTCCIPTCGAISRGRSCAPGARSPCRSRAVAASRSWPVTASRASAKAPARPTCSPAPASTKPGPTGSELAEAVLELWREGQLLHQGKPGSGPTSPAGAPVGSRTKAASRKERATASIAAS